MRLDTADRPLTITWELEEVPDALDALGVLAMIFRKKGGTSEFDELLAAAAELVRGSDPLH